MAPGSASRPVREIAVVGLGTMGCGIAETGLSCGFSLRAVDSDDDRTAEGIERIRERIARQVRTGLVPADLLDAVDSIQGGNSVTDACRGADLVIESVPEDWTIKGEVLAAISAAQPRIIATNTSSFPIERLAEHVHDPSAFLGVHFFNPAEWIPGVEVVPGPMTHPAVIAQVFDVLRHWRKVPVLVQSSPGFLANRLQLALFVECLRCVEEGLATPEEIDAVVSSTFGFRLPVFGPFGLADMAGLDVYASILDTLEQRFGDRFAGTSTLRSLVASGALGLKAGRGFRSYSEDVVQESLERRDIAYARLLRTLRYED
ncbi:MAG: 3-hydroxyacyl-CoA dehydrogenase family protein [Acidimicrobiales bacterium]